MSKKLTIFNVVVATLFLSLSAFFIVNYFYSHSAYAASFYWVGGDTGNENDWNNVNNWSASSGGAGGVGIPGSGDEVIFDDGSSVDCTLDTSPTVTSISTDSYSGTFSIGSYTLTISDDFSFRSGSLNLNSGDLVVAGDIDIRDTTFDAGTSKITMNGSNARIWGGNQTLYDLYIETSNSVQYISNNSADFSIDGELEVADGVDLDMYLNATITMNKGSVLNLNTGGELDRNANSEIIFVDATSSMVPTSGTIEPQVYFKTATQDIIITNRNYGSVDVINETANNYQATLGTAGSQSFSFYNFRMAANGVGDLTVDAATYNPDVDISSIGSFRVYFDFYGTGAGEEILNAGNGDWNVGASDVDFKDGTLNAGTSNFIFDREYSIYYQEVYSGGNSFYQITNACANTRDNSGLIFRDSVTANTFTYTTPVNPYTTQLEPGITVTLDTFDVSGDASHDLVFQPYGSSATWNLEVTNEPTVSYVDVQYSDASGGAAIDASDGTNVDSGNNLNWKFGPVYWVSSSESDWSTGDWSYSSGGASGASAPTSSDDVVFDSNGLGDCNLDGDIDIASLDVDSGYSGEVNAGSHQMSISGAVDLTGGFDGTYATLVLDGTAGQTITFAGETISTMTVTNTHADGITTSGTATVGTLNATTAGTHIDFDNSANFTVLTTFNVSGTSSDYVYLHSDSDSDQWNLSIPSSDTANFLDVQDSVVDNQVTCTDCVDSGNNNINWVFDYTIAGGMVGYWKLDDDFNDYSGNNNDGTNSGVNLAAEGVGYESGKTSTEAGASFNDDNFYVAHSDELNISDKISFSTWVNPSDWASGDFQGYMCKGDRDFSPPSDVPYCFGKNDNDNLFFSYRSSSSWTDIEESSGWDATDNAWFHLVVSVDADADEVKFYVNNDLKSTVSGLPAALPGNTEEAMIGEGAYSGQHYLGLLDEVRLYNRVISSSEREDLYKNAYNGTGNWSDYGNWDTDQMPSPSSNVFLESGILALDSDKSVAGITLDGGTFDFSSKNLTVTGDVDLLSGSVTASSGTLILAGTSVQTLTSDSDEINDLTITNSNTVNFSGSLEVSGTLTNNTASSTMTFDNTAIYTINNISLDGQAGGTKITLESDSASDQWSLIVSGSQSVSYVTVSDSDASSGDSIDADDGTNENGGNNLNWLFPPVTYYWVGSNTSWNNAANWSDSSGGAGGAGIPGIPDTAVFDNQDATDCVINTTVSISTITNTNYAGELDADTYSVTLSGNLTWQSGTLSLGSDVWTVAGDVNLSSSTVNADDSTLMMTGNAKTFTTGNKTINNFIAKNTTSSNYEIIVAGNLLLGGNLYVAADGTGDAALDLDTNDGDVSVAGDLDYTGTGSGSEDIGMGDGTWVVTGSVDLRNGSISAVEGTFAMNGADEELRANDQTFYNLQIASEINIPYIYNDTSDLSVSNYLIIDATGQMTMWLNATLTMLKDSTLSLSGPIAKSGGGEIMLVDPKSTTLTSVSNIDVPITFRASTRDIYIAGLTYGRDIYIENNSSSNYTAYLGTAAGQTISVNGSMQIKAEGSGDLAVDGATYNPTVTTSNYGGYRRYFGFFGSGGGLESLSAGSGTWTVGASDVDFRNGVLNAGTSNFVFNREYSIWHQHIYAGGNSFNIVTCQNTDWHDSSGLVFRDNLNATRFSYQSPENPGVVQFAAGTTASIFNFEIEGRSGRRIILKPYGSNSTWYLNTPNQTTLSYVEPYYSDASIGSTIYANDGTSVDGGNNNNWVFPSEEEDDDSPADDDDDQVVVIIDDVEEEEEDIYEDEEDESTIDDENELIVGEEDEVEPDEDGFVTLVGEGTPGADVIIKIRGKEYLTKVGEDGKWRITLFLDDGNYNAKVTYKNPDGSEEVEHVKFRVKSAHSDSPLCDIWCWIGGVTVVIFVFFIILWKRRRKREGEKSEIEQS